MAAKPKNAAKPAAPVAQKGKPAAKTPAKKGK